MDQQQYQQPQPPTATMMMGGQQQQPSTYHTGVFKEPRGMIRLIQLVFAILAFSITVSFDTETSFTISCYKTTKEPENKVMFQKKSIFLIEYPFDMSETQLKYLESCDSNNEEIKDKTFPMDFSSSAQFFVCTGVLSFLYTIICLYFYIKLWQKYETNQFFPILDLSLTSILTIFWLAGATAWAANVSDLKYYSGPRYLIQQLDHCNKTISEIEYDCFPESPGKWSSLYISLIFGFANLFIWGASIWFVFKETYFHQRRHQAMMNMMQQPGTAAGMGGMGGMGMGMGGNTMNTGNMMNFPSQTAMMQQQQPVMNNPTGYASQL